MATRTRRSQKVRSNSNHGEDTISVVEDTKTPIKTGKGTKSGPSKRRKTEHTSASAETENVARGTEVTRTDRRVKGRRGHLKFMTEIPLDTLYDIFRELDPVDLLHLSWANKTLRNIVMEKSARYLWEQAFERLYASENPPPHCPQDLNLAQYTHFLFAKKCMECSIARRCWSSWTMRSRLCLDCLASDRFVSVPSHQITLIVNCLPVLCTDSQVFCSARDYTTFSNRYSDPKWCSRIEVKTKDSHDFTLWENRRFSDREKELRQLRGARQTTIQEKLAEAGWTSTEIHRVTDGNPHKVPGFSTAKKLTEKGWDELQPRILERLEALKKAKFDKWRAKASIERWTRFKVHVREWAKTQKRARCLKPLPIDLVLYEPFRSLILAPSLEEDVKFWLDDIERADAEWTESRNKIIISRLPEEYSAQLTIGSDFQLPILAAFMFRDPKDRSIGACGTISQVCEWRAESYLRDSEDSLPPEDRPLLASVRALKGARPWLWDQGEIQFSYEAHGVAKELLTLLGLDPRTTSISGVRRCHKEFKCILCGKGTAHRPNMDWEHAIKHELHFHKDRLLTDLGSDKKWEIIEIGRRKGK